MRWPFTLPPRLEKFSHHLASHITVDRLYYDFKHVMVVGPHHLDLWTNLEEFDKWCQMNYCFYIVDRALYSSYEQKWYSNGIGGGDYFFIATNSLDSFLLAQLRWG